MEHVLKFFFCCFCPVLDFMPNWTLGSSFILFCVFTRTQACTLCCSVFLRLMVDWLNTTGICILRHRIIKLEQWKRSLIPSAFSCFTYIMGSPKHKGLRGKEGWAFLWISKYGPCSRNWGWWGETERRKVPSWTLHLQSKGKSWQAN